jgi:hypothetical protein
MQQGMGANGCDAGHAVVAAFGDQQAVLLKLNLIAAAIRKPQQAGAVSLLRGQSRR